jgi:predicted nucleic acid-binding protein
VKSTGGGAASAGCSFAGNADYIVSGDADLLSLDEIEGVPIVDAPTFWRTLVQEASL